MPERRYSWDLRDYGFSPIPIVRKLEITLTLWKGLRLVLMFV